MTGPVISISSASTYSFGSYSSMPTTMPSYDDFVKSVAVPASTTYTPTARYVVACRKTTTLAYFVAFDTNAYSAYANIVLSDITDTTVSIGGNLVSIGQKPADGKSYVCICPGSWGWTKDPVNVGKYLLGQSTDDLMMVATDSTGALQKVSPFGIIYVKSSMSMWWMIIIFLIIIVVIVLVIGGGYMIWKKHKKQG